ncbi:MAG: APC family permease [Candidatus Melainabacteria bacterium]
MSDIDTNPVTHHHEDTDLKPTLGWFSATMLVTGSMIGSGIFFVTPDIARHVGTGGLLLLVWILTGLVTLLGAASYAKLAVHMPRAGGQYVFLKEALGKLPAFLYGWSLLTVVQTGTLAAIAVAFANYAGILFPAINSVDIGLGLSTQKLLAVLVLVGLTVFNCRGIDGGVMLQNVFTSMKILALVLVIGIGLTMGSHLFPHNGAAPIDWSLHLPAGNPMSGDLVTLMVFASVGALFSADAWNYVTFIGGEIKNPRRNLPIALIGGTVLVCSLYAIVNLAYLNILSIPEIQTVTEDRVATLMMDRVFPGMGMIIMALVILVSTFGCLNGLLLAGARVFYAMAKDGLLFHRFAELHPRYRTPNFSMWVQCLWSIVLALSGTYNALLGYIMFTAILFYILTMIGLFRLAGTMPVEVQMTRWWDKAIPATYILFSSVICFYLMFGDLFIEGWQALNPLQAGFTESKFFTSWAGLILTGLGWPIYAAWERFGNSRQALPLSVEAPVVAPTV